MRKKWKLIFGYQRTQVSRWKVSIGVTSKKSKSQETILEMNVSILAGLKQLALQKYQNTWLINWVCPIILSFNNATSRKPDEAIKSEYGLGIAY